MNKADGGASAGEDAGVNPSKAGSTDVNAAASGLSSVPRYVDAFEFVRLGRTLQGTMPVVDCERLISDQPEQDAAEQVQWSAAAGRGPLGESLIRLHVRALLTLRCQRCLGPLPALLESEVALQVVETEAELDDPDSFDPAELDDIDAEADFEKVLGSRKFDLHEQVEDELILCVPYVPKHDVCPAANDATSLPVEGGKRPSPFASLAGLKSEPDEGK